MTNSISNKTTENDGIRSKLAQYASYPGMAANFSMILNGPINNAFHGNPIDWSSIYKDPLSLTIGLVALSSSIIAKTVPGMKGKFYSQSVGLCSVSMLTAKTVVDQLPLISTIGKLVNTGMTAYTVYTAYKLNNEGVKPKTESKIEHEHTDENKSKLFRTFKQNIGSLNKKYPFGAIGLARITTNLSLVYGAFKDFDDLSLMISSPLWTTVATMNAASLPKVDAKAADKKILPEPQI